MTAHVERCQVCGGYTYTPDANELERMRANTLRALDAAEKYEADEPFAYYSAAIPVAVVTSGNARQVLKLIDRLEAAEAENERLRSCLEVTEEVKSAWKARAEAAERVLEPMRWVWPCPVCKRSDNGTVHHDSYTLAAWEATTPLHANTADVTVQDSHGNFSSQLTSEVTSTACEDGAE